MIMHTTFTIFAFTLILLLLSPPLGLMIASVSEGRIPRLFAPLSYLERAIYSLTGIKVDHEMTWLAYARSVLTFSLLGIFVVYSVLRAQHLLPLNPMILPAVNAEQAFNIAVSFVTNTNWQSYGGESTLSFFSQTVVLTVQNFISAAVGLAVFFAVVRGFTRARCRTIGNFWVDLTRGLVYVLLPLSIVLALLLSSQGVVQTLGEKLTYSLLDPAFANKEASVALGPVASQIAIKQLGTNGGGFYNANSSHPFENPNFFTNLLEAIAILLIPCALCWTFGALVKDPRQGKAFFLAMGIIALCALLPCIFFEYQTPIATSGLPVNQAYSDSQPGGNMEGKESRFGVVDSSLWAIATTAASNGSVNAMHDSFSALGGLFPLLLMQLGEVIFGGVGSGLYGMLAFALVTVFLAGLMVGRTPEYLGKKIEAFEMKMVALVVLIPCVLSLIGTAIAVGLPQLRDSLSNPGAHGLTQALYAYSSMSNNNGSAFGGFGANTVVHNLLGAVCMFIARFWVIIPLLAMAGALAEKQSIPPSTGTLPTHGWLFMVLLMSVILIVGALTFIPALALGPIIESLQSH